jgi:hypothetical protein
MKNQVSFRQSIDGDNNIRMISSCVLLSQDSREHDDRGKMILYAQNAVNSGGFHDAGLVSADLFSLVLILLGVSFFQFSSIPCFHSLPIFRVGLQELPLECLEVQFAAAFTNGKSANIIVLSFFNSFQSALFFGSIVRFKSRFT